MSDHPDDGRLEAIITLPKPVVQDMTIALAKRSALLAAAEVECKVARTRGVLRAAHSEVAELLAELRCHLSDKKPYRYVVPLTADEARVIDEELNHGSDATNR